MVVKSGKEGHFDEIPHFYRKGYELEIDDQGVGLHTGDITFTALETGIEILSLQELIETLKNDAIERWVKK